MWADGDKNTPRIARQEYYIIYVLVHARHGTGRSGVSFKFKCHTDRLCGSRELRVDPTRTAKLNKLFPPPKVFFSHTHVVVCPSISQSLTLVLCRSLRVLVCHCTFSCFYNTQGKRSPLISLALIIVCESRTIAKKPPRPAFTDGAVHSPVMTTRTVHFTRPGSS